MTDKEKIADLLSSQPLYKKISVSTEFLDNPTDLEGLSFAFYCPIDKSNQTFKLKLEPSRFLKVQGHKLTHDEFNAFFESFNDSERKYKFTQHYSATCQYCNQFSAEFLLKIETDIAIPANNLTKGTSAEPAQIVRKVGQFPSFIVTPDHDLMTFLSEEDRGNYQKALICRSQDYGIGAFAYLRRIVENELIRIVEDLSKIDRPESTQIKLLLENFKENHVMANLIEGIYDYLPTSLKNLGNNPLKILYSQLSGGIHEFSEEQCSEKASDIDIILKFVVKKIREENSDVRAARDAMKTLQG